MPRDSQKLKQRALLISILNKYRDNSKIKDSELEKDIKTISAFEGKDFVLKTLLQETETSKDTYGDVCSVIIHELLREQTVVDVAYDILRDTKISDNKKFILISILKQRGHKLDYDDIEAYIKDPEVFAQSGVENFLEEALYNPDVQLDLLDFYTNIPKEEKLYFVDNLIQEQKHDGLANAFSILIQLNNEKDEFELLKNYLVDSSSPYALVGLNYILENKNLDTKSRSKIKKTIKTISLKYPDFKNDFLIKDSKVDKCYISFVDGRANFSLLFTRKKKDGSINMLMASANINAGITSCMGFYGIDSENYSLIIKRLFSDSLAVKINPVALKSLYEYYYQKSLKNNIELPYELVVWKNILSDIRTINYDISEFLNEKLDIIKLTKEKVKKFVSSKMLETWYYSHKENEHVDALIDEIEKEHIVDLDKINELVSKTIDENFLNNKKFISELQSKLLIQAYVASLSGLKITSCCAYSLCFENPYTKMLVESSIDKSLYYYFSTKAYELEENNCFKKNIKTTFTKDELEILMAQLEEKWS